MSFRVSALGLVPRALARWRRRHRQRRHLVGVQREVAARGVALLALDHLEFRILQPLGGIELRMNEDTRVEDCATPWILNRWPVCVIAVR